MNKYHLKFLSSVALAATAFVSLFSAISVRAATATVQVGLGGFVFVPATTNINAGDSVIWNWATSDHSSTSDTNGIWDSGVTNSPHTFTNLFPTAGRFPYHCTIHVNFGMKGVVNVAAINVPPTVTVTNPAAGTVLSAPANVTIQASAQDSDGSVTNVQFLVDASPVGNSTTAPYSAIASNLAAGSHTLTAIASDNLGATGTNSVTISVITPVVVSLSQAKFSAGTNFQFRYSADVGLSYVVQRSTNLLSAWTPLQTDKATSNPMTFVDSNAVANPGFYRVGRLPNP